MIAQSGAAMALLTLFACAPNPSDLLTGEDPSIVLGSATDEGEGFENLAEGADVPLIAGSQGGFHVWLGIEFSGYSGRIYIDRDARRIDDGTLVLRASRQAVDLPEEALTTPWQRPLAIPSFMCPSPLGVQVYDREIELAVRMLDEHETLLAEDRITVIPRCPEGDHHDFCLSICGG